MHFGWDTFQTSALYCTMQLENYIVHQGHSLHTHENEILLITPSSLVQQLANMQFQPKEVSFYVFGVSP